MPSSNTEFGGKSAWESDAVSLAWLFQDFPIKPADSVTTENQEEKPFSVVNPKNIHSSLCQRSSFLKLKLKQKNVFWMHEAADIKLIVREHKAIKTGLINCSH